jgi:alkaline phosphatase
MRPLVRFAALLAVAPLCALLAGCAAQRPRGAADSEPTQRARNVILFIGDGMGMSIYTAARVWQVGVSGRLAIDSLPHTAICSTWSWDGIVADSAPTATALLTGVKAPNDVVGQGSDAVPGIAGDPASGRDGTPAMSIGEMAAGKGLATGIVTTTTVTHATPASMYAHIRNRNRESEIAAQLLAPTFGNPAPDVLLGGGRHFFLPRGAADPEYPANRGQRADGRDLTVEVTSRGWTYVWNGDQLAALDLDSTDRVLGLFEPSHMQFELRRATDPGGEPSLVEMTEAAIRILSRNPRGYFLLVEGGRIDHALHGNNVEAAIAETVMFDDAVRRALEMTSQEDTLILVTADHSHPLTINGDALVGRREDGSEDVEVTRRNLMGSGGTDLRGREYPVLTFATGPGGIEPRPAFADRPALVPRPYSTHAGEDVLLAARGPGAERVRGFVTNSDVFEMMKRAYGW